MDEAMGNTAPLLARIGEYLQDATRDRFKTQSGPDGTAWQPLQPRYQRRKKQNKDKILTLRGYLRGQIHWQPDGDDAVLVGTNSKYGAIHQFGGDIDRPAYSTKVRLRTTAKGDLMRQKGKQNLAIFARKTQKRVRESWHEVPAHQIKIPARPYLGINAADQEQVHLRVLDWLNGR
ncbi:phage virion morphogenesis protein [Comamonas testosteroni]